VLIADRMRRRRHGRKKVLAWREGVDQGPAPEACGNKEARDAACAARLRLASAVLEGPET
jgi:hypothetical protein